MEALTHMRSGREMHPPPLYLPLHHLYVYEKVKEGFG